MSTYIAYNVKKKNNRKIKAHIRICAKKSWEIILVPYCMNADELEFFGIYVE